MILLVMSSRPWYLQPIYFVSWWYGKALLHVFLFMLFLLASVEDYFSILVMLKAIVTLQPLHQDFSLVGRGMGVTVRLLWLLLALVVSLLTLALCFAILLLWLGWLPFLILGLIGYWG